MTQPHPMNTQDLVGRLRSIKGQAHVVRALFEAASHIEAQEARANQAEFLLALMAAIPSREVWHDLTQSLIAEKAHYRKALVEIRDEAKDVFEAGLIARSALSLPEEQGNQ